MRKGMFAMLVMCLLTCCSITLAFANEETSLDDIINNQQGMETEVNVNSQADNNNISDESKENEQEVTGSAESNQQFIDDLTEASNLAAADIEGAEAVTSGLRYVAAWIFQIIAYAIITLLAVRIVLDLAYIALPFTRGFLGNGASAGMQGNPYGASGYGPTGMNQGIGMSMGAPGRMMNAPSNLGNQGSRVQLVSNAAIVAAESEGATGPNGKPMGPLKMYIKNMVVVLVLVPVLIVLAATGALTQLGLLIGNLLVGMIGQIGNML